MTRRTRSSLFRSAALVGAIAAGSTAFGGIHEWTPAEGGTTYWDDAANWNIGTEDWTDYRIGNNGAQITFRSAVSADDVDAVLVYNGEHTLVAEDASFGLSKPNAPLNFQAPWWFTGNPVLNITSGTYQFGSINLASDATYGGSATLNLNGGALTAPYVTVGADCTIVLNGGTLSATTVGGDGTLSVAGGTFANGEDATVSATLSGSGTLTKTGAGTLAFTGSYTAFTGKIAVAEGAGSVTVGDTTIAAGEELQLGVYTWTGAGTKNSYEDPNTSEMVETVTDADLWSNVNNWLVNGVVPTAPPAADSKVVIPAGDGTELSIRISGDDDCTGFLTINRDVKFVRPNSGTNGWGIRVSKVEGTGKLTLAGNNRGTPLVYDWLHIYTGQATDGEIIIDTDLQVEAYVQLDGTTPLRVNGAFSGGARFTCYSGNGQQGVHFHGDTSGFTGSYTGGTRASGSRDGTEFYGSALGSASGSWTFGGEFSKNAGYSPLNAGNGVTYKFGQLTTIFDGYNRLTFETYHKSSNSDYASNVTLEVGGRANSTSNVGGAINGTNNKIVKVGTTSTLNFTASESVGTVEAKEGTTVILGTVAPAAVKFAGTGATIKIARSTTTTTEVATGVENDPETEEDESVTTETTTTDNIAASFVPTFIDEFAGYQYSEVQDTVDGVAYDVYTVAKVAKDANDTEYYSVSDAITALADAENKTITLINDYDTAIELPLGYTLALNGHAATVAGAAGVAVSYDEATQTYTTVDNSSATWQGAAAGANWADAANWSTGAIPDEGTAVKFTYNALVYISDHDNLAHKCASMDIANNVTVEFAPPEKDYTIYPRVAVYGDITGGKGTLKLWRSGIINLKSEGNAAVYPAVQFENPGVADGQTRDSWFQNGFTFHGDVTGTGVLVIYNACTFNNADINVPEGSVVDFRANPTLSHSTEKLTGTGTVIVHATPANGSRWKGALQNSTNWQGVTEVQGAIDSIDAANFGGTGSTVRFNGVTGYLRYSVNSTTEVGKVKTIEIGANGLTLNNGFSSGTFGYIIAADITGSGPIHFGTRHNDASVGQYFLTGSLDGFTGAIDFGSLTSYRPAVIIKDANTYAPAVNDYGQIIVAAERTVTVSGAWNAPGGFVVLGNVNVASTGSITSTNGLCGNGTVTYAAIPATAPGCFAGGTSSGTNREIPAWTGTVVLPARTGSGAVPLAGLGTTGSKIVVNGITGTDANSIYLSDASAINGTVEIAGAVKLTNGSTGANYTFAEVTGTGDMFLSATGATGSPYYTYTFTKLTDYTGEINAVKTSDSKYAALAINTVAVSEVVPGTPVVKLAANSNLTTDPAAIAVEVGGEATEVKLFKADDGNLYVAVAEVAVTTTPEEGEAVTTTTPFATYEAAAAFADQNSVTEFTVLYGDGAVNGWDYDSEAGKLTKNTTAIARVGTTQFNTLAAAFETATVDDTVVLFGASADAAALSADGATLEIDTTAAYTGTISGNGTVVADAAFTPVFGEWIGTFVINWAITGASAGTAFKPTTYGNANSTVKLAKGATDIYLTNASGLYGDIGTKLYFGGNVSFRNGWGGDSQASTIPQLGADEGVVVTTRQGSSTTNPTYLNITVLKDFAGSFLVNSGTVTTIGSVDLAETPAVGTKVVSATVADGATACSITGQIAEGYPLVAKEDGLYFDPVAQVGTAYYNTLADAITAANGATVALVKSTDEGVVVAGGQTVVIQFGDYSTGDITAATDYILNTNWDDATKTGTYTTTAVAAYLTVGETVTPYTVAYTALTDFIASATGSTLRFVGTNPFADTTVPCTTYDAATLTYTKLAAVAQIGTGPSAIQYPTLAEACTAAEQYKYDTVTLLVALGEQTVPDGWDYNAPAEGEEGFGTLTKEMTVTYNVWFVDTDGSTVLSPMQTVESGATATKPAEDPVKEGKVFVAWTLGGSAYDFTTPVTATITLIASWENAPTGTEASDGSGNKFTVPATVATPDGKALTDAATGTITYAQAYALGLWDGTAEGAVAEPEVTIAIVDGAVQVAFAGGTVPSGYTVSCQLQSKTELSGVWTDVEGATGATGVALTDSSTMGEKKFYQVKVTIVDKQ